MNMSPPDTGPEISPGVTFLYDLLKWVAEGRVRVPGFQRPYVWTRNNVLELLDSVRSSYPIGTLMFWIDPSTEAHKKAKPFLGPFEVPMAPLSQQLLVVDGQQRITTLAGALLPPGTLCERTSVGIDSDPNRFQVYFDAASAGVSAGKGGDFTYLQAGDAPEPWQIPVSSLSDTARMFAAIGEIFKVAEPSLPTGPSRDELIARIQTVARAFQSYQIPFVQFKTSNVNLAVESFARLNRKGVQMGPDEMFSALTFQEGSDKGFNVAAEIDAVLGAIQADGFGDVDRLVVLRTFLVVAELDPFRTNWARLGQETKDKATTKLPDAMRRAKSGLLTALQFLKKEGVYNARMLPYGLQLLGLGLWFAENPVATKETEQLLRRWLWLTSFAAWFGQGNPSRYFRLFDEMRACARTVEAQGPSPTAFKNLPWSTPTMPFPTTFDLRSARVRAYLCVWMRSGAINLTGATLDSEQLADELARRGPSTLRRIVAGRTASNPKLRELASSPANRVFDVFGAENGAQAWNLLAAVDGLDHAFWDSHQLDPIPRTKEVDKVVELLTLRRERLMALERAFLTELDLQCADGTATAIIDNEGDSPSFELAIDEEDV